MAGAATIRALVNRPHAEPEIRGSRARSGSRGSRQDHDGPGLVSDRLHRPHRLGWQLRAGETRPVSNAGSLRGSTQGRCRRGWTCPDFVDTWVKLLMLRDPTVARRPGG